LARFGKCITISIRASIRVESPTSTQYQPNIDAISAQYRLDLELAQPGIAEPIETDAPLNPNAKFQYRINKALRALKNRQ
jgi:hypothetical protein